MLTGGVVGGVGGVVEPDVVGTVPLGGVPPQLSSTKRVVPAPKTMRAATATANDVLRFWFFGPFVFALS